MSRDVAGSRDLAAGRHHHARPGDGMTRLAPKVIAPAAQAEPWIAHSLARGTAGIALLHIERAHRGQGTWQDARAWIKQATAGEISAADSTGLYLGAPAIAFMLHAAHGPATRCDQELATLHAHVARLAHRRAQAAMTRISQRRLPAFGEYDVFSGLTGIGAYLLRADPGGSATERILSYLVALTRPLRSASADVPGWWVAHGPQLRSSARFPGGHGNLGAAHGITGPLLLLSQATRRGVIVDGQPDAIGRICAWMDSWRQDSSAGSWWPQWVDMADLSSGRPAQRQPARPSWCYGTAGIARAQQLAGVATGNKRRQAEAEDALENCLNDARQTDLITDAGLCHGWAGIYQTTWRAARDALTPRLAAIMPDLAAALTCRAQGDGDDGSGFLDGAAGTALALSTATQDAAPASGWDTCLLIA